MVSKKDKNMSMCDTAEAQQLIRKAFSERRYGSVKAAHNAAYDFLRPIAEMFGRDLKFRRVRQLWEGKARIVSGWEKDALRRAKIEEARRAQKELRRQLAELDEELALLDTGISRAVRSQQGR